MQQRLTWILVVGCLCRTALAADWPNFFGPTRNGLAPDTGLNKDWATKAPRELWRVALSDGGYAGPSVAKGKVFIMDHVGAQDIVRALDLKNGQQVWQYVYADLEKANVGFSEATPAYSESLVYTVSRLGTINCLTAAEGKPVWSKSIPHDLAGRAPGWLWAESACVDDNKLVICTGAANGNVVALDKKTGQVLWTGGNGDPASYGTAVPAAIRGQKQFVVCTANSVLGLNAADGKVLWSFPWQNSGQVNASQPVVEGNFVFITSGYGIGCGLFEITADGAVERWRNKDISAHFSSPLCYKGYIYSDSDPGNLVCMSQQSGQVAWKQGGFEKGALLVVDGVILALDGAGGDLIMVKADPTAYQELGRIRPLGGQSWTSPVLADGRLIVRNPQAMVCLDLR